MIGITVASSWNTFAPEPTQHLDDSVKAEVLSILSNSSATQTSGIPESYEDFDADYVGVQNRALLENQMQWMAALHSCTIALRLKPKVSGMLRSVFLEKQVPVALYIVEKNMTLLVASSELQQKLPTLSAPQSMRELVNPDTFHHISNSIKFEDLRLYKKSIVTLCSGEAA